DLVGKVVSVDDRVRLFQLHPGRGIDEVTLKRTPVVFRLPACLRFPRAPEAPAIRIEGVLKREGGQLVCDVTDRELLPKDLERLNRGVDASPAGEFERRAGWARWAERRAKDFDDRELLERARAIDGDAIRIEAEHPSADPSAHWLRLARRARE